MYKLRWFKQHFSHVAVPQKIGAPYFQDVIFLGISLKLFLKPIKNRRTICGSNRTDKTSNFKKYFQDFIFLGIFPELRISKPVRNCRIVWGANRILDKTF